MLDMEEIPAWKKEFQDRQLGNQEVPPGAIRANLDKQAPNNSYDVLAHYADKEFICVDCGKREVWTAKQQQWWYEVAKGPIQSTAVRCHVCRRRRREEKQRQREHMEDIERQKGAGS